MIHKNPAVRQHHRAKTNITQYTPMQRANIIIQCEVALFQQEKQILDCCRAAGRGQNMALDSKGKQLPKGIRQKKDGRYEGRFTYKGESYTFYSMDLKALKKEIQDKRYEVEHGIYAKETKVSVNSWFSTWMEEYKKNTVKYGTYSLYEKAYRLYVKTYIGRKNMADIRPEHIQAIYNKLQTEGYSSETIKLVSMVLNGMFKQAYKNQMILRNPVDFATAPRNKKKKKEFRVMSQEEQKIFLEYASRSLYYNLYIVALGTGMRSGELRALEWKDIDFKNKVIHVKGTLKYIKGEGYKKDTPKTATSQREIPMLDEVWNTLKRQRKEQRELKFALGDHWQPTPGLEDLVFPSQYHRKGFGIPIGQAAINDDMKKIVCDINQAGIEFESITPHTLRHTFATRGLENGIPPKVMQELLGHTSITMTLDIYSHVLPDTKAAELQKIANMF